jgi:hypothetical protein
MRECLDCRAEATHGVYCAKHAPVYHVVACCFGHLYETRSLRRAWEAERYYQQQGYYREASITVPDRVDLDFDGVSEEEQELLDEWTVWAEGGRLARFYFCLAPEDDEMAKRAEEAAQQARAA